MAKPVGEKLIVDNRRARHDYHLLDRVEAGLVLTGTEVKALREGEAWLVGLHVPEYGQGNRANHEPDRPRKLLMHRREIDRLYAQVREKGFTLVPTRLYFKDGKVKAEIAVGRGKELRDKRRAVADRDARRQIERELKSRR
jgi:SsrA-binding protein